MHQLLPYFIAEGEKWVAEQRTLHRPGGALLSSAMRSMFEPFFDKEVLDGVRFKVVSQISNPGFYASLRAMERPIPLDFGNMLGITFVDTVLLSQRFGGNWPRSLYFHELVHVVQYRVLGVAEFMKRYVRGWAEHECQYEAIPLEMDAYDLQALFEANPSQVFSVQQEVARRISRRATS